MKKPEIPQNETERLATLRALNILDTEAEERFDRATRIAKRMFAVPIAAVSLVDENRQWFKSCIGLSATETSRDISFCGHAIHSKQVFIIPDATQDVRFSDNPLVLGEPHIRFYAGYPLEVDGYLVGTLCIIDQVPRQFNQDDELALTDLASMIERELCAVQLATIDQLTGISNRRGFLTLAQNNLDLSLRNQSPITLIYLDLDQFKPINDTFGHAEGDALLVSFALMLAKTCRASDIHARIGGDEFALLLNGTDKQQAQHFIERFSLYVNQSNQATKRPYDISFSYGIVEVDHQKHATIEQLLSDADERMYQSKRAKKGLALTNDGSLHHSVRPSDT